MFFVPKLFSIYDFDPKISTIDQRPQTFSFQWFSHFGLLLMLSDVVVFILLLLCFLTVKIFQKLYE